MKSDLLKKINDLEHKITTTDISAEAKTVGDWGGADVIIKSKLEEYIKAWLENQPVVISLQSSTPRRRAVITKHASELSWLFFQLKDIFAGEIDYITKYDFYGLLAQSALDYLAKNEEAQDAKGLLLAVLDASKGYGESESSS